jgi:hypothetical protein
MRRRDFIAGLGSAAACLSLQGPVGAQRLAGNAWVGFLHPRLSAVVEALRLVAIREGLITAPQDDNLIELVSQVSDGNLDKHAA